MAMTINNLLFLPTTQNPKSCNPECQRNPKFAIRGQQQGKARAFASLTRTH